MKKLNTVFAVGFCGFATLLSGTMNAAAEGTLAPIIGTGDAPSKLRLTAKVDNKTVSAGEPVVIHVSLTNSTNEEVSIEVGSELRDYKIDVKNDKGQPLRTTRYWHQSARPFSYGSGWPTPIPAGQSIVRSFQVNRLYDMTQSGKYQVTVSHLVPAEQAGKSILTLASSNTLEIQVVNPIIKPFGVAKIPAPQEQPTANIATQLESPSHFWRKGDAWRLHLSYYLEDSNQRSDVTLKYHVQVHVVGSEKFEQRDCWQLDFTPEIDAPAFMVRKYRFWVDKEDGMVRRVQKFAPGEPPREHEIENIGEFRYPLVNLREIPADFYPATQQLSDVVSANKVFTFSLNSKDEGARRLVESRLIFRNTSRVTRQKWARGAKWWSEYEVWDGADRRILSAQLVPFADEEQWGTAVRGLQLSAALPNGSVGVGEPVLLRLALKKTPAATGNVKVSIALKNQWGGEMSLTEYGKSLIDPASQTQELSFTAEAAEPLFILLNRVFDMTQDSLYSISVTAFTATPDNNSAASPTVQVKTVVNPELSK